MEVSEQLFGEVSGYNILLAIEEAGAHVEYLYQHGFLFIANLSAVENGKQPQAAQYQQVDSPVTKASYSVIPLPKEEPCILSNHQMSKNY